MHHPLAPSGGSGLRWVLGTLIAVVLIGAASVVVITAWRDTEPSQAQWVASRRPSTSPSASCPTDTNQHPPDAPPDAVAWTAPSGALQIRLPDGGSRYGPCRRTDTTAAGYAHTPTGALIAATQLLVRTNTVGEVGKDTVRGQVVAGPAKQRMLANLSVDQPSADQYQKVAGYSITAYSGSGARVLVALTPDDPAADGAFLVFPVTLRWETDWKLLPPPEGDWAVSAAHRSRLPPLTPWTA